jgi:hypothetical protein
MLYNIVRREVLVADVLAQNPLYIEFQSMLANDKWVAWLHLVHRLVYIALTNEDDKFIWKLIKSGTFIVKSIYADFLNRHRFS